MSFWVGKAWQDYILKTFSSNTLLRSVFFSLSLFIFPFCLSSSRRQGVLSFTVRKSFSIKIWQIQPKFITDKTIRTTRGKKQSWGSTFNRVKRSMKLLDWEEKRVRSQLHNKQSFLTWNVITEHHKGTSSSPERRILLACNCILFKGKHLNQ